MTSLIIDRRQQLGNEPGFHAVIIGVSSYPFLAGGATAVPDAWGMSQLSATATSANEIAEWLSRAEADKRLPRRLATLRLLLSPAPTESLPATAAATLTNTRDALREWRKDCNTQRDNVGLFYFAGHGVQRSKEDAALCLEDFLDPNGTLLERAISISDIRDGMAPGPGFEQIARTQMYFVDACRVQPAALANFVTPSTSTVFNATLSGNDDRSSPIFFASVSNKAALSIPAKQTLFSMAVLECLEGEAGEVVDELPNGDPVWGVTVNSLNEQLCLYKINQLNQDFGADQTYAPGGASRPTVLCTLPAAPKVRVRLLLDPAAASNDATFTLQGPTPIVLSPFQPHPLDQMLSGGMYTLVVDFPASHPTYRTTKRQWQIKPARFERTVKVS
jgi:hypothetical protein